MGAWGALRLERAWLAENLALQQGGALWAGVGAAVRVYASVLLGNAAGSGGAVYLAGGYGGGHGGPSAAPSRARVCVCVLCWMCVRVRARARVCISDSSQTP